ncbi:hypothetical protein FSPOR_753 [Fusarium sporotrichioides]|uniref:Uncharacterized protein n=1 Tax=Fusarium sporotrichioides TaxID=5514 RepID=A0A395ST75_FUSSP|nr:hypothetical protein FSPOR_753 [Fusarium sporotrichioides]
MELASLLASLSSELIYQIVDYSCPYTILALALTCSTLHHRFKPILEQHRNAYNKHRVSSDLSPETVLALLKDGPSAKIERWHIRELEIWGSREGWEDWRSWVPDLPSAYGLAEEDPSRSALSIPELQRCIRKGIDFWEFSGDDIDEVQQNLESGSDAYLKLLLIASCPRLQSIRFVKRPYDTWSSLLWIERGIKWSKSNDKWPPGFKSLQNVAVGISTGLLPHEDEDKSVHCAVLAALLYLPRLKNLYFCEPFQNKEEEEEEEDFEFHEWYDFPTNTSSVESLFLDSPCNLSCECYDAIASAPKELETLVIRARTSTVHNVDEVDSLTSALYYESPQLKRFAVYNGAGFYGQVGPYPCFSAEDKRFQSIKLFSVAASALEECSYDNSDDPYQAPKFIRDERIYGALPSAMEAMYVWGPTALHKNEDEPSEALDSLLARIIESGAYQDLKVIYVENVESAQSESDPVIAGRKEPAFQKTLAAGRKAHVHVCTLMNNYDGGYWKNFPAKPDRFDLKTGPCGKRPADWKLNLYTGEWVPQRLASEI